MRTQRLGGMAAMLAIVGLSATALSAQAMSHEDKAAEKAAVGTIATVAEDHSSFELQMGEAEQSKKITVTVNADTTYEIDGEDATAAEVLVVGKRVKVRHKDAVASKVSVMEKGKDKDKGADKNADKGKDKGDDKGKDKDSHEGHGH